MIRVNIMRPIIILTASLVLIFATQGAALAVADCFSCHDSRAFKKKVNHAPAAGGDCLSCHSPHVARYKGLLQKPVKDLCYSCHTDEKVKQNRGFVHLPVQKGECMSCHSAHASDYQGLLNQRPADTCFSCHSDLPKQFKNTHTPYGRGQCSSCHQPHQSDNSYLLVRGGDGLCLGCHNAATVRQKHPGFPTQPSNCSSCHSPHGSDRKGLIRNVLHDPFAAGCNDCHSGNKPVLIDNCLGCHPDVADQMASSHNHLVRYEQNGCVACHSPHAGDDSRLLKGKERHICGTCHESTFKRSEQAAHKHRKTEACNDCHAPHGSNHPAMLKGQINAVCGECHGHHATFSHPTGERVFDPRTGQVMTCGSCHATKGTDYEYHTRLSGKRALCVQCHTNY